MRYMWKFLNLERGKIKSRNGDTVWKVGEWQHVDGDIKTCERGLHASKKIYEAFSYVQGEVLARVEVKGKHDDEDDKSAYSDMRVVKAYRWTKKDSVALAIFSAEICLKQFERLYPDDKRPREAIEAARAVLKHDTAKNRSAAESAARLAARSAVWSAESAARLAVWSAESAARSAESAAESAARLAESAARSAESAVWSAAWSAARLAARLAAINKIERWFKNHIKELEEIK